VLQKEAEKGKRVEEVFSKVTLPRRVEESEPRVVAELFEDLRGKVVAEDEEDVWVAPVAKPVVAESSVAMVVEDRGRPSAIGYPVSEGKRRRVEDSSVEKDDRDEEVTVVVPSEPRGGATMGPRGMNSGRGVPADLFVRQAYRFVNMSLIGEQNGMVGDTYHTRGNFACAPVSGIRGAYVGRGYRPYH